MNQSAKYWVIVSAIVIAVGVIAFYHYQSGARLAVNMDVESHHTAPGDHKGRQQLTVAFVPVTCHLTCPVTDYASKTTRTGTVFDAQRFTAFPAIVEAIKAKRIEAAFLTVPLAMQLREQGVPVKICCLGHRNGSAIMIQKDSAARNLADLKGKTIAIPSPFSNENILLRMLMRQQGLKDNDIKVVKMAPPDMPTALAARAIDGFVVAEPFCSAVERNGTGRILYSAKDIWPHYISCALVVHEDLIKEKPEVVRDLVRGIVESGEWAETNRENAARLVAPYFRQDVKLLNYVLTQPRDRVSYRMLTPGDKEMQRIEDMGIQFGILHKRSPMSELMDKSFIPPEIVPVKVDTSKLGTIPSI